MGMNIKNAETERLTRELAASTGESLTAAVTAAVRERLERVRGDSRPPASAARRERVLELGRQIASVLPEPWATSPHGDLLYDEAGLPK